MKMAVIGHNLYPRLQTLQTQDPEINVATEGVGVMEEASLISVIVIIVLGIFSQWLAWRVQWPSIVIMSIAGLLIGPIFGLVNPEQELGDLYRPLISLAVAIILFEASSGLDVREIKGTSASIVRIVTFGMFISWIGGSLAAHYVAGLNLEISFIIGGLFIVTGPTVITPLLRQAKLEPRISAVLKWEGIILDPIGPLLALLAYQVIKVVTNDAAGLDHLFIFFLSAIAAAFVGFAIGMIASFLINRGLFPEYLKSPVILSFVLLCFGFGELMMNETGMLAVTILGLTLARTQKYVASIGSMGHFVENISILLTSTVFILITASLPKEIFGQMFRWPIITFVLVMLFIIRPLSIWISTIGTELTNREKILVSWIAPRGIVALAVSGYFAAILLDDGYQGASILTALTFALVFITVCAHGFTLEPLAKKFGLANTGPPGILIIGASEFSVAFADHCKQMGIPVLMMDHTYEHLKQAKEKDINTYYGEILSEHTKFEVDLTPYEYLLAMTDEAAYNALVCQSLLPEFGYSHTFALPVTKKRSETKQDAPPSIKANVLFGEKYHDLNKKISEGYTFTTFDLDDEEKGTVQKADLSDHRTLLFIRKKNGVLSFATLEEELKVDEGDEMVVVCPDE